MSACSKLLPALALLATPAGAAGPLAIATELRVEQRVAAPDGTTRIVLAAPARVVPGDRIVVTLRYRNAGAQPLADLVLANPVPRGIAYRAATPGTPEPEVSIDGRRFAALSTLRIGTRAAQAGDVVAVRWRLAQPLAPGAHGAFAFAGAVQ